jgi:XapX domain-containing protein
MMPDHRHVRTCLLIAALLAFLLHMKDYLLSFSVGLFVGVLYYVLRVRSPAPPIIALTGLLGMVPGEMLLPFLKRFF